MPKSIADSLEQEFRSTEQEEHDLKSRRSALVNMLEHAQKQRLTAVQFLDLVESLDLAVELDEIVAGHPERQCRLDRARRAQAEEAATGPAEDGRLE